MRVHSYESLAAVDGKGLRYALFLAGCPLRCVYCHNPDTQNCPAEECDVEKLTKKILRYKPFFQVSGGGVTFSGGEPLLQAEEICRMGELLRKEGVGYTLDTSGYMPLTQAVKSAILGADLVICDLKFATEEEYKKHTGVKLQPVIDTLDFLKKIRANVWVRTVVVPGINDNTYAMDKYLDILKNYPDIEKYELLGFHTLGFHKYEELCRENPLEGTYPMDREKLAELQKYVDEKRKERQNV